VIGHGFDQTAAEALLSRTRAAHTDGKDGPGDSLDAPIAVLRRLALPPGAVLVIALPNSVQLLRLLFAGVLAGYVPVLMAPSTPAARLEETAARLGASAVISSRAKARTRPAESIRIEDAHLELRAADRAQCHQPGQMILLTSGTSGMATGCLHDISALLRNARRHADAVGLSAADTVMVSLPMYYSFALVAQVLGCLVTGASLVISGPPFSVSGYGDLIDRWDVTHSSLTPTLINALLKDGQFGLGGLRTLTVGGQSLPPESTAELLAALPDLALYLTYGLTQAGPRVSTLAAHREPPSRYGSVGLPLEGVHLALRDVGRGPMEQEVLVTTDTAYRQRVGMAEKDATRELIAPRTIATGDLGHIDEDGYLYLRGRSSDFAIVRGEKVSLASVRAVATSIPGIISAVAKALPETDSLELRLYADATAGPAKLQESDIRRTLFSLLAPHERPGHLSIHPASESPFSK
jgi:acyl-CoA synthetase (AMP-forming)/AMP-acid ligase II